MPDEKTALTEEEFISRAKTVVNPEHHGLVSALKTIFFGESQDKAAYKMEHGLNFSANDYAYVPDPDKPITWKVRLTQSPGKVTKEQLVVASNELVGNQAQIPTNDLSSVRRRIRAEFRKMGASEAEIPNSVKATFSLLKQADGTFRWWGIFSNNYRDDDRPAEIISAKSHENFAEMVKMGIFDPPELWIWHAPGSRIGVADYIDVVQEGEVTFSIAAGTIDVGMEEKAQAIATLDDVAMSHGMPMRWIRRDKTDPTVIIQHVSKEISVLPRWAAANKYTGFLIKEKEMPLTDAQTTFLRSINFGDTEIEALNSGVKQMADDGDGRDLKEAPSEEIVPPVVEEAAAEPEAENKEADFRKEIAGTLAELLGPVVGMIKSQNERMADIESTIAELKSSDASKISKMANETPVLSLKDLVAQALIGNENAAIIDGRSALAKNKPAQAESTTSITGIPFLDKMMSGGGE